MNALRTFWVNHRAFFSPFVVMLLAIMFVVEFVKGAILVSILPVYMKSVIGATTFVIGWTMALQYIGDNLFRSPIGWLIDKAGYKPVMLAGVAVTAVSVVIFVTFTQYGWILLSCALLGIGTSPLWPCVISGATESVGEQGRGTVMSIIYVSWMTGVGLGPIVINLFINDTYTPAFRLLLALMAASVVLALFMPAGPKEKGGFRKLAADWRAERARLHGRGNLFARLLGKMRRYMEEARHEINVHWAIYPALFAQTFALGLLTPVLTLYARTVLRLTPVQYSLFLIAGGAITVLFLIPVGKLVDRWGGRWFLRIGILLASFTLLTVTFVQSIPVVLALVALVGIGYAMIIPSWSALIASIVPEEKRAAIWGFFLTIEGTGNVIGPIVSGKLWDSFGHRVPFVASGIVLAVLFVLQLFISPRRRIMVK